ncbi:hypothetical protein [Variovorax guangxiensis]|uniref:Uncharacterized protein n=1 Tax=Variovorax guangxiensis TaxID=1775474 RepID=A0A840G0M2_9BURK|nr:hypothetical protein [Variovorax guangxiensis]MBB4226025.1 hypothetical protein [Variovorax guangxiensis]
MPLDPSIILQAGRDIVPLKDPSEIADEQSARQLRQIQLQLAQQGMADDQAYRSVLRSGAQGADQIAALQRAGLGKQSMEAARFQTEQQKAQAERGKVAAEAMKNGAAMILSNPTEENAIRTLSDVAQQYQLPTQIVDNAKARIYSARNDPNQLRQLAQGWGADAEKVLGKFTTENLGGTLQTQRVNPLTGQLEIAASQAKTVSPDSLLSAQTSMANNSATIANSARTANMTDTRARELAVLKAQEMAQNRRSSEDSKNTANLEKKVTAFSTQLDKTNIPQFEALLGDIEAEVSKYSQRGDIPGYGATGSLPQFLLSSEGKELRQKIAQLQNLTLKDRSGAAVTNQELQRYLNEIGTGAFANDKQLLTGLAQVRRNLNAVKQNVVAGVDDATLNEYQQRGGIALQRGPAANAAPQKQAGKSNSFEAAKAADTAAMEAELRKRGVIP